MKLCSKCGSIIMPSKVDGKSVLKCSCGHVEGDAGKVTHKNERKEKEIHVVDPDAFSTDATTKEDCSKCGHDEAYYTFQQTRSADEPPTKFLKCTKCKHTWRDYS